MQENQNNLKNCKLCEIINEKFRIIKETKYSFAIICRCPIKFGHIMVVPKKHVTQKEIYKLSNDELRDFNILIQEIEDLVNKISNEDESAITFKNSNIHSSQEHLHYHILPSKGSLRDLFSNYENTQKRKDISIQEYELMKNKIQEFI